MVTLATHYALSFQCSDKWERARGQSGLGCGVVLEASRSVSIELRGY
jgi:hypothetical protein